MKDRLNAHKGWLAALIALSLMGCGHEKLKFRVASSSMAPTLKEGAEILVAPKTYQRSFPRRWEIIAFHAPGEGGIFAMRVVGLPGETVLITDEGLLINGKRASPPSGLSRTGYLPMQSHASRYGVDKPYQVPEHSVYVLGDNSGDANDSRFWGALATNAIIGKVVNVK